MRLRHGIFESGKTAEKNGGFDTIKKILLCISLLFPVGVNAGGINNNAMKAHWSNPAMSRCKGSDMRNATIGTQKDICKGGDDTTCRNGDDTGVLMLVARDVNENGARFCVTTVQSEREKKGNAWTLYFDPKEGQKCEWLCKPGYAGDGCKPVDKTCDSVTIKRSDFDKLTMARGTNVESQTYMFHWNEYDYCGRNSKDEHDMILGISNWTDSGHGAFARPFVVRGSRNGWKDNNAYIRVWPEGSETLLCKAGYQPNGQNTDCEPIDKEACGINTMCTSGNWTKSEYNPAIHELKHNEESDCNEYRCSAPGHGFSSATSRSCVDCGKMPLNGINSGTGVCEKCKIGEKFNQTLNKCDPTTAYIQSDMTFGKGKDSGVKFEEQCWIFAEPTQYNDCVNGTISRKK